MYSENSRMPASRRADDDFLRRMIGGNLNDGYRDTRNCGCGNAQSRNADRRRLALDTPPCNDNDGHGCSNHCPKEVSAPSLAMVYCPRQCWQSIFSLEEALQHGTLFAKLALPFYGSNCDGKEACNLGCGTGTRRDRNCNHGCKS